MFLSLTNMSSVSASSAPTSPSPDGAESELLELTSEPSAESGLQPVAEEADVLIAESVKIAESLTVGCIRLGFEERKHGCVSLGCISILF